MFACFAIADSKVLSDDDIVILEVSIDRHNTNDVIEIFQDTKGKYFLPIGAISQITGIGINVLNGMASGFIINEEKFFTLDAKAGKLVIKGVISDVDKDLIISHQNEIYVESSLLSKWLPMDFDINFSDLILVIKPREKLPFQLKQEREGRRNLKHISTKNDYETINSEYKEYSVPVMNMEFGYDYSNRSSHNNKTSFSILSSGDVGYMTNNFTMAADSDDSITSIRTSLGKKDLNKNLLGKMHASEFLVGDINSVDMPLVATRSRGRGLYVSNFDLNRLDQFDSTSFIGDSQPGWEVELYWNDTLLDFVLVGEDGRYEFLNIPVFYGDNIFRIVSYGPQGQVREETQVFNINSSILKQGEFGYKFSADEKSRSLFGIDEERLNIRHDDDYRLVTDFEYGITDKTTMQAGFIRTPLEDGITHNYANIGFKSNWNNVFTQLNVARDLDDGGQALGMAVNTRISGIGIRLRRENYYDFVSEVEVPDLDRHTSISRVDIDGRISGLTKSGLSYRFGYMEDVYRDDKVVDTFSNRLFTSLNGIGLTNEIQNINTKYNFYSDNITEGEFSVRGSFKRIGLRLSFGYELQPEEVFKTANLSIQKNFSNDTNIRFDIKKDLSGEEVTTFTSYFNKMFDDYRVSTVLSGDDDGNFSAGMRLGMSVGYDDKENRWFMEGRDITSSGIASISAFLDSNYNGERDYGEELISDINFKTNGGYYKTSKDSSLMVNNLRPYNKNVIEVDAENIRDPFIMPAKKGVNLIAVPGKINYLDFAFQPVTEIDGNVFTVSNNEKSAVSGIEVRLIDINGTVVDSTRSEFDGFYIFYKVPAGNYKIEISPEMLVNYGIDYKVSRDLEIKAGDDVISNFDIIFDVSM